MGEGTPTLQTHTGIFTAALFVMSINYFRVKAAELNENKTLLVYKNKVSQGRILLQHIG